MTLRLSMVTAKNLPKTVIQKDHNIGQSLTLAVALLGTSHLYSQQMMMTHQLIKKWVNSLEGIVG